MSPIRFAWISTKDIGRDEADGVISNDVIDRELAEAKRATFASEAPGHLEGRYYSDPDRGTRRSPDLRYIPPAGTPCLLAF